MMLYGVARQGTSSMAGAFIKFWQRGSLHRQWGSRGVSLPLIQGPIALCTVRKRCFVLTRP